MLGPSQPTWDGSTGQCRYTPTMNAAKRGQNSTRETARVDQRVSDGQAIECAQVRAGCELAVGLGGGGHGMRTGPG